jgi:lipopolysaccharide export system protein LptA
MTRLFPLALLFLAPAVLAAELDRSAPLKVNARSVELNEKTGTAVYRGNVTISQGPLTLRADRLDVRTEQRKPALVVASGAPVIVTQTAVGNSPALEARARSVRYQALTRVLDMEQDVFLRRADDTVRAHTLHLELGDKHIVARGDPQTGTRIHAIFYPKRDPRP